MNNIDDEMDDIAIDAESIVKIEHEIEEEPPDKFHYVEVPMNTTISSNYSVKEEPPDNDCAATDRLQSSFSFNYSIKEEPADETDAFEDQLQSSSSSKNLNWAEGGSTATTYQEPLPTTSDFLVKEEEITHQEEREESKCEEVQDTGSGKHYKCTTCNKCFVRKYTLLMHTQTHLTNRDFKCYVCESTFKRKSDLSKHMHLHGPRQQFGCPSCDKVFLGKDLLRSHIKNVHMKPKPQVCEICKKTLLTPSGMKKHMLTHSSVRPYECEICHQRFHWREVLKKHMKSHISRILSVEMQ